MSLPKAELDYQLAHIHEDRSAGLKVVFVLGLVLSDIALALRLISRRVSRAPLRMDDYTIIVSVVLIHGLEFLNCLDVWYVGLGKHAVAVGAAKMETFLKVLYAYIILYTLTILTIKNSILLLYHRVFVVPTFQLVCKFWIGFILLFQISTLLVDIFTCTPIKASWNPSVPHKCINQLNYFIACAALNVFTDIVILVLPMPMIWRLQISMKQKLFVCGIFLIGGVVCIATIFRIVSYFDLNYFDLPYTFVNNSYWTNVEIPLSIICACLPTMRPLFRGVFNGSLFSSSRTKYAKGSKAGYTSKGHLFGDETKSSGTMSISKPSMGGHTSAWHDESSSPGDAEHGMPTNGINVQRDIELRESPY